MPKAEAVVFWGGPNTEVEGFEGVVPNTDGVGLAGTPKPVRGGFVTPVPPKTLVGWLV